MSVENLIREREIDIPIDSQVKGSGQEISYKEKKESARALELVEFKLDEIRERLG